jgi:membrane-bound lytic murein transglycosylase D
MVEKERIAVSENVTKPNQTSAAAVKANAVKETETISEILETKPTPQITEVKKVIAETGVAKPEIKEVKTIIADTEMKAKPIVEKSIIAGTKKVAAEIAKDELKPANSGVYSVVKSDNLYLIAKEFNTTVANLKEWNNLESENIAIGDKLVVIEKKPVSLELVKNKYHVVAKGEFIGQIARNYNTTINELLELNNLSSTSVQAGTKLVVGKENSEVAVVKITQTSKLPTSKNYKAEKLYQVKKGDSLFSISKAFSVPIADIKKWNEMKDEKIQPGMKLKING